ncbi:MAG: glutamate formimidoyltransferase [Candidatus Izemoplasmatales bacterium]|nr:glutamate formimidoyltransferase [Candidatus Izemoplasmatales bacterium]MDD4069973.1 glutamate formimidoyltransferase [Candidatus Izemoplasmatales bacterium]MDY0139480.1 glutamate formimidoyltransferase [Candidatus Izemoplasmatales bacterium]
MAKTVECVPNFSEGRDSLKIERIVDSVRNNDKVKLINYEADADYNRTVVTLIGDPEQMIEVIMNMVKICLKEIDLNNHTGEHARMGAIDVIPFIPVADVSMNECVDYANILAEKIAKTYSIPCFLYAEAAREEKRISLPNIRKGEFEGMKEKIKLPEWAPDYGEQEIHPTFGVIGVGARDFLIAYNIDVLTKDEKITGNFAKAIRQSSGGYQFVQAGPVFLENRGHTQVTMNILNFKKNPIYRIFEAVKTEAKRYHLDVPSAEIVGLIPKDALVRSLKYYFEVEGLTFPKEADLNEICDFSTKYLKLRDFTVDKIIDYFL